MIIVKLKGGLGNQLFQYSFGRLLAIKRNETLKLDISSLGNSKDTQRNYKLDNFNIKADIANLEEIKKYKYPPGLISQLSLLIQKKIFRQFHIGWEPNLLQTKSAYFEGYFQSYKYLEPIRNQLLLEITLNKPFTNIYLELLIKIKNTNSVAIHIRRGDFVKNASHQICDIDYYQQTIKYIKEKIPTSTLFVFSDDVPWAKQNLKTDLPIIYVSQTEPDETQELMLMSQCQHQIIANSTFSWWGAWLNKNSEKIVIAPKKWNNRYQKHYKHLIPEEWITI